MQVKKSKYQAKNIVKLKSLEKDWRNQDDKKCPDLCPETETGTFI